MIITGILGVSFIYRKISWTSTAISLWASYQIHKIAGCACAGNAGNIFPRRRFKRKPLVSDPGMHHGTCVTHVPWCMSGSLACGDRKTFPAFPAHAHPQFCVSGKSPMDKLLYPHKRCNYPLMPCHPRRSSKTINECSTWMSNYDPRQTMDAITYPCLNRGWYLVTKRCQKLSTTIMGNKLGLCCSASITAPIYQSYV